MSKEDKKETFIFYKDWYNMARKQRDGTRLKLYDAICQYVFDGTTPADPSIEMVFDLIKDQLDRDRETYEKKREKQRARVMKRWHPDGIPNDTTEYHGIPTNTIYDDGNVDKDEDINPLKEEKEPSKEGKKNAAPQGVATLAQRSKKFYNELVPFVEHYGRKMIRDFYDYWTEPNKSKSKMRFELEKTWDLNRRLVTWANRESSYDRGKAEAQSVRERNAELGRQEQREREAKRKTPEQRQAEYEAWCKEHGKNPADAKTAIEYSQLTA